MAGDRPKKRGKYETAESTLTVHDIRFCKALFQGKTQRQAYLEAGYPPTAVTESSIDFAACARLKNSKVKAYLKELSEHACAAAKVDVEELAYLTAATARLDLADLYRDGCLLPPDQWPLIVRKAIDQIDYDAKTGKIIVRIKANRQQALDRLAKWVGMIGDKPVQSTESKEKNVIGGDADPSLLDKPSE
jgi:hypothetical protein